ncbi:hypothetical protein YC2023_013964 [Brassica napus]
MGTVFFLIAFSDRSTIRTGKVSKVRSFPRSAGISGKTMSCSDKHFRSWDTWNTLWYASIADGKSNLYATAPTLSMILNGPKYLGSSFFRPETLVLPLKVIILRYTRSLTSNSRCFLRLSA